MKWLWQVMTHFVNKSSLFTRSSARHRIRVYLIEEKACKCFDNARKCGFDLPVKAYMAICCDNGQTPGRASSCFQALQTRCSGCIWKFNFQVVLRIIITKWRTREEHQRLKRGPEAHVHEWLCNYVAGHWSNTGWRYDRVLSQVMGASLFRNSD